jgi:carbohydrate-binding DOMON domain-containing protein
MRVFKPATLLALLITSAQGQAAFNVTLKDPRGDDDGPGKYTYPTDPVYKSGSFDLMELAIKDTGNDVQLDITFSAALEDPWGMQRQGGGNFSIQFIQIYVDTDHKSKSGELEALPGMNATFADESAYERVILISPQPQSRLRTEVAQKAAKYRNQVVIPRSIAAKGRTVTAVVSKKDLGQPTGQWGWQALISSNEGYAAATDLLSRKVNEFEGAHRFGGGDDYEGDPHFLDILVSPAKGGDAEKDAQHKILSNYRSGSNPAQNTRAVLPMVYGK